jgi:hypothetical protein
MRDFQNVKQIYLRGILTSIIHLGEKIIFGNKTLSPGYYFY